MKATILIAVAVLLTACSAPEEPATAQAPEAGPETPAAAETLSSTDSLQITSGDFGPRDEMPGAPLYAQNCAQCHDGTVPKAPHLIWLEMMTPKTLLAAMNEGIMRPQAAHLSALERQQISEYITRTRSDSVASTPIPWCEDRALASRTPPKAVGWGHDTNRNTTLAEGGIPRDRVAGLKLKWSFVYPGALRARSQPSVGWGAVFTGSQDGTVYAFDLDTGCVKWTFEASAEVRTGIVLTTDGPPLALFGDILAKFYAVNALTGELVWSLKADDHPSATLTGTPAYHQGTVYVPVSSLEVTPAADPAYPCCTFRGNVLALNAADGAERWRHYTIPEAPKEVGRTSAGTAILAPSGAPVWSSPTIDARRNLLYVGSGENYSSPADANSDSIIAVNLSTGERAWTRQTTAGDAWNVACMMADNPNCPEEEGPDFDHGSSILLVDGKDGKQVLAAGHKDGSILILNPDKQGELLWTERLGRGSIQGGVHFGLAAEDGRVYVPINDMNDTRDGKAHDPKLSRPGVASVDIVEQAVLWQHVQQDTCGDDRPYCDPGISAPISSSDGVIYAGHLDGYLRAYDALTGDVLFSYDTTVKHTGSNGIEGQGGGISGAGPTVAEGHLVLNSGYGLYFHEPGNLLLVFAPEGAL